MTFPTVFTVGRHAYTAGATDEYGEIAVGYTPAKDATGTQVAVYAWAVPTSTEPKLAGHDRVIVDLELLAPPETLIGPYDLVDITDGEYAGQYEVLGDPADYNHGPWLFRPGKVINLRKVSG